MEKIHKIIRADIVMLHSFVAVGGVLTHDQIRGMLALVRQLKTRLEVLDADLENKV